jgi:hypothetical protein
VRVYVFRRKVIERADALGVHDYGSGTRAKDKMKQGIASTVWSAMT